MPRRRATLAVLVVVSLLLAACSRRAAEPPAGDDAGDPRLVVLIVVDQFRADYLDRYGDQFQGGLARLAAEGVVFTEAVHDHANTSTAPGHATISTGVTPRRHGIIGNGWYERDGEYDWAVGDEDDVDPSPRRLLASTVGDWLRRYRTGARIYSVAGKDRSAVMMGGHDAHGAFWYSRSDGEMETSEYYFGDDPDWLDEFNRRGAVEAGFGDAWEPLPIDGEELDRLGVVPFDEGPLEHDFPRPVGGIELAPDSYLYALYRTPRLDEIVADFALHLIDTHDLGGDAAPDLLAVGLSAADTVGHNFGPDSRELLDTLLRLDRTVGELLDEIDRRVGAERVAVVLTADHGVSEVPELREERDLPAGRPGVEEIVCMQRVGRGLAESLGPERWLGPGPFVDEGAMARRGVSRSAVEAEAVRRIETCPSVARVWTRSELEGGPPPADPVARRFYNAFHPERSPDLTVQYDEHFVNSSALASHGTVYDYDARVPIVVRAPGVPAGVVERPVRTVDVAPTIAALLGLPVPADLDGRPLPLPASNGAPAADAP